MTDTTAFRLADAQFQACQHVAVFIDEQIRPRIDDAATNNPEYVMYKGLLLRAIAWLRSLGKLNHPGDFQAAMAGSRAMFEIALDLVLLHRGSSTARAQFETWEDSARLKTAETIVAFYGGTTDDRGGHLWQADFITREGQRVRQARLTHWGSANRHPMRWTNRKIGDDAATADTHLDRGFRRYHLTVYPQRCWGTHGSGLVGVRNISADVFPYLGGQALEEAARFALVAAEVTLRCMDLWGPAIEPLFDQHAQFRNAAAYAAAFLPRDDSPGETG